MRIENLYRLPSIETSKLCRRCDVMGETVPFVRPLALMIFCLVERAARQEIEKEGTKKIARLYAARHDAIPTGRLIFQAFQYLQMVELRVGDEVFRRLPPLTLVQERLLSLLGVRKPP